MAEKKTTTPSAKVPQSSSKPVSKSTSNSTPSININHQRKAKTSNKSDAHAEPNPDDGNNHNDHEHKPQVEDSNARREEYATTKAHLLKLDKKLLSYDKIEEAEYQKRGVSKQHWQDKQFCEDQAQEYRERLAVLAKGMEAGEDEAGEATGEEEDQDQDEFEHEEDKDEDQEEDSE